MSEKVQTGMLDKFPRVQFELEVSHPGCWAETLSNVTGGTLEIEPIESSKNEFMCYVVMKKTTLTQACLRSLKHHGLISEFRKVSNKKEGMGNETNLWLIKSNWKNNVSSQIVNTAFEINGPVWVKGDREHYAICTFDLENADKIFGNLLSVIRKNSKADIIDYKREEVLPREIVAQRELDDTDLRLLQELLKSKYFELGTEKRPTQAQMAKTLDVSVGTVNRRMRSLESLAFSNLLSIKPDLTKFRKIFEEIEEKEKSPPFSETEQTARQ